MSDDRYTRCDRNGKPDARGGYDRYTIYNLKRAEAIVGLALWIVQAGFSTAVAASGNTHAGAGALDISIRGMSRSTIDAVVKALRKCGFAAWYRPPNWDNRGGGAHIHAVLIGDQNASDAAKVQWGAFRNFLNGLANHAVDRFWHPARIVNAPYGKTTKVRVVQLNMPGEDKLGNVTARIAAMWRILSRVRAHVIGWNEGIGVQSNGHASEYMHKVDAKLGRRWLLVKPTRLLNENYISYRGDVITLLEQAADEVLEAPTGGRHATLAAFRYNKTGFIWVHAQVHLVDGNTAAHERDRQAQAADALKAARRLAAKHGDCPVMIQGDMNTAKDLTALVKAGMKRTRKYADEANNRDATTYTKADRLVPSTNPDLIWDHQYVDPEFYVVGYSVLQDLDNGRMRQPRPSDHFPVITSLRAN